MTSQQQSMIDQIAGEFERLNANDPSAQIAALMADHAAAMTQAQDTFSQQYAALANENSAQLAALAAQRDDALARIAALVVALEALAAQNKA